ncbi:A24 family peptidase [Trinickia fusca]|uniref:Peptidase A24 n=1 Tax=Trinickia fusca TaxID=2419777 RepID=A0A494X6K9_9BURK|nr:prepilin peptidase [Trinickia fusca]RKP43896.1 peptidase A24 [Trinickia fusca]
MSLLSLPPQPIPLCVIGLVVVAASTDIVCRRIPNLLIWVGLVASLLVQAWARGPLLGSGDWFAGGMAGFALLVPIYVLEGMGGGDVKLLLMIGSWVGPLMILYIALVTFVIGGAWSIAFSACRGRLGQMLTNIVHLAYGGWRAGTREGSGTGARIKSVGSLPYGVAIAAGTVGVLIFSAAA